MIVKNTKDEIIEINKLFDNKFSKIKEFKESLKTKYENSEFLTSITGLLSYKFCDKIFKEFIEKSINSIIKKFMNEEIILTSPDDVLEIEFLLIDLVYYEALSFAMETKLQREDTINSTYWPTTYYMIYHLNDMINDKNMKLKFQSILNNFNDTTKENLSEVNEKIVKIKSDLQNFLK